MKITEKVSFNIASRASYIYNLNGQKFIENAQKWSILATFWKPEPYGQTVLPDRSLLIGKKLLKNAKFENLKCDIFGDFQPLCLKKSNFASVCRIEFFFRSFYLLGKINFEAHNWTQRECDEKIRLNLAFFSLISAAARK